MILPQGPKSPDAQLLRRSAPPHPALLHTSSPLARQTLSPEGGPRLGTRSINLRTSAQRSRVYSQRVRWNENLPSPSRALEVQVWTAARRWGWRVGLGIPEEQRDEWRRAKWRQMSRPPTVTSGSQPCDGQRRGAGCTRQDSWVQHGLTADRVTVSPSPRGGSLSLPPGPREKSHFTGWI